jgi:hypothetical protein
MRLDGMQRVMGPSGHRMDHIEMDYLYELESVRSASAETFEWRSPNSAAARVTVLRAAFGDPRQLRADNTYLYGAPVQLGPNVVEYPPSAEAASSDVPFRPRGGRTLFTFSDGTWVRADAWMAQRLRSAFVQNGPPPPPVAPADVAWEICARGEPRPGLATTFDRATIHILAGRDHPVDMYFRYASPDLAARAQGEHRFFCGQSPHDPKKDKGIFEFRPPCEAASTSTVEGPYLHYTIRSRVL